MKMVTGLLALCWVVANVAAMGDHSGDACSLNPCGPNTRCQVNARGIAVCRCLEGYFPKPDTITGCGPQCTTDSECGPSQYCSGTKCEDPCARGVCGIDARCEARNHRAICRCPSGYTGDPFTRCRFDNQIENRVLTGTSSFNRIGSTSSSSSSSGGHSSNSFTSAFNRQTPISSSDMCSSFSCGFNAECLVRSLRPVCVCRSGYEGDPYAGCRRVECEDNSACPSNQVCHNFKCINPCSTTCGVDAECEVRNHVTVCRCPRGYTGDPFTSCTPASSTSILGRQSTDYCTPTPCGANSNCRVENGRAVCSCQPGYFGNPIQGCRHECETDADCDSNKACLNFRCQDPCSSCGTYADCSVQNHRAICRCPENFLGDPYTRCYPECTQHEECRRDQACFNLKCVNPCNGACGVGAECTVNNHKAVCSCPKGYTGHPFDRCRPFEKSDLCNPNPCGQDADCKPGVDRSGNDRPVCFCRHGYLGDPLIACRKGQCMDHNDCAGNQACYGYECVNPCASVGSRAVCGFNARCDARNHGAVCSCPVGYDGDPLNECRASFNRG